MPVFKCSETIFSDNEKIHFRCYCRSLMPLVHQRLRTGTAGRVQEGTEGLSGDQRIPGIL